MRWLSNRGILAKIVLASVPLFLALAGFGAYSTSTLLQLGHSVASVNGAWKQAVAAVGNENDVLTIRSDVGKFLATNRKADVDAATERAKRIGETLGKAGEAATDKVNRDLLVEAGKALDEFVSGLAELAQIQAERSQVLDKGVLASADAVEKTLVEVMRTSYHDGDATTAFYAGSAVAGLAAVRSAVQQFLQQAHVQWVEAVNVGMKEMSDDIALILSNSGSRFTKRQVTDASKKREELDASFKRLVEITRKRDVLMDAVVNQRADRLVAMLSNFTQRNAEASERASAQAQASISTSVLINIVVAASGLAAALLISLLLGRSITRPITALVAVMRRLADGDRSIVVPFVQQRDEVGAMAQAVQVFKANADEVERLRSERLEAEAHSAAQRRADMERLASGFEAAVGHIVEMVSTSAAELEAAAGTLSHTADTTQRLTSAVASASEEASGNVHSVAAATEELTSSVHEIARQVDESSKIAEEAVHQASKTDARIAELSQAASRIGDVVKFITAIAEQTNLLALNATIEAARAGEAGRGFAVVAQEVKALAAQTAKATDEIGTQIAGMQTATRDSVSTIKEIAGTITRISDIATTVAAAVEEQGAATQGIALSVHQAAQGTTEVASKIGEVDRGAAETGAASGQVLSSARALAAEGAKLKIEVDKFLASVRAA